MAIQAKRKRVIVDEMAKFDMGQIGFLFELIKDSRIPGRYLPTAMAVVQKLKTQYKLLEKEDIILKKSEKAEDVLKREIEQAQQETYKRVKKVDGELYIDDE